MKCTKIKEVKYLLELSEDEAKWLRNNMQNPLHVVDPNCESEKDLDNRTNLFDCLSVSKS